MRLLKKVGDLLDSADENSADLQSLTRHVGDALGAQKAVEAVENAKRVTLDFGIVEGLSDLKNQLGSDLQELKGNFIEKGEEEDHVQDRLAALRERVAELRLKEAERGESRSAQQARLQEVERSIQQLEALAETSDAPSAGPELLESEAMEAMQAEFLQREAASRERLAFTSEATQQAAASNEHLLQQLDFWREKAKQLLASLGLQTLPEDIDVQLRKLDESGDEDTEAAPNTDDANVHAAEDCAAQRAAIQVLEASLAELMRSSEEMMGRVDEQHRHERELAAKLEAVEALSAAQAREEGLLRRKLEEARAPALDAPRLAPAASSDSEHRRSELTQLKAQVEDLRRCAAEWSQENSSMEARLGRLREKAAEDLERAVPSEAKLWTWLDEPLLKLVTLLVKSTCLRRSFALHLLATCKRDRGGVLEVNKTWLAIQIDSDVLCHDGNFRHFFCIWARDQHGLGTPAMSKCAPQTREREHHREGESEGSTDMRQSKRQQVHALSDEEACWEEYGPNIYTVNEQYIKPVTLRAGKMSWALMRHRDGLDCDLFISHAWQEGVFEFLAKVRHSWPRGLRHAWCCMLANPQNLNIEVFLASPANSPFAVALRASEIVLVVSNRHASVYSRLWCAYEAYLAQEEGKVIVIATASHVHHHLHLSLRMVGAAIFGACVGRTLFFFKFRGPIGALELVGISSLLSFWISHNGLRMVLNCFGQAVVWFQLTNFYDYIHPKGSKQGGLAISGEVLAASRMCYWLMASIVFYTLDVDRVEGRCTKSEAKMLRQGYTGIEDAECSQEADERAIRSEIGDQVDAVNHAIEVLMAAGMSTAKLRKLDRAGVNIKGFAFSEITGAVILIGPWGILASVEAAMTYMLKHGGYWWFLAVLPSSAVLGRVILIVLLCLKPRDERCFVLKVMSKFMAGMFGFFAIGVALSHVFRFTTASLAGSRNTEFLKLVERTEGAFQSGDDTAVEDSGNCLEVRRILAEVRVQYDQVHLESERREAEIAKLREQIRVADRSHGYGADESTKKEDSCHAINKQFEETTRALVEAKTSKKVYTHMCERITKEQALLKEKLLLMEAHLQRKSAESQRKVAVQERLVRKGAQCSQDLDILEQDVEHERVVREDALAKMASCLQAKIEAGERRKKFEEWRHEARDERVPEFQEFAAGPTRSSGRETDDVDRNRGEGDGVALDAANEAFNASAGRLRKLYAARAVTGESARVEKLAGNCLQKVTFEQVERSQNTEDGFQKIREVTGLADVMDIVHKFLNRDVEHEQLKSSVKEAEMRLDTLREQFERFKRDTDGITFDTDTSGKSRAIYLEVEEHEAKLNLCQKEHEQSRDKLQQSTLQVEHMKRWANRMGRSLSMFEDCVRVEKPSDLPVFYQQMQRAVDKFIAHIVQQISSGKARASCAVATGD
ncbi:Protein terminal ear1-like [Durusdinium trenchii]|uniref:Protein terminal ear1-like n=1 Tax=Durusdinium trenchii TaxID=1381693 RepID=A0ABP0HKZ4_9DINO